MRTVKNKKKEYMKVHYIISKHVVLNASILPKSRKLEEQEIGFLKWRFPLSFVPPIFKYFYNYRVILATPAKSFPAYVLRGTPNWAPKA